MPMWVVEIKFRHGDSKEYEFHYEEEYNLPLLDAVDNAILEGGFRRKDGEIVEINVRRTT